MVLRSALIHPARRLAIGALSLLALYPHNVDAGVTVFPADTAPLGYVSSKTAVTNSADLMKASCPDEFVSGANIVISSALPKNVTIYPSSESFVRTAIDAWAQHQHLLIRPEEVWFTVLVQMNFFMSKHGEELRSLFVDFEGKQEIEIWDWTWEQVLIQFQYEIQKRVKTDWLLDWITPNFTTSTPTDAMTANVLMMGLMQTFFEYTGGIICGLPSVTLLGERKDWVRLLNKLDHLKDFGAEPTAYAARLKPIFTRFVKTFDAPDSADIRSFWNTIIHAETSNVCGAPPYYFTGWLMGFFYWDQTGAVLMPGASGGLTLDGVDYPRLGIDLLPVGYAKAPFTMLDYGGMDRFPAYVLAGNIGRAYKAGVPDGYAAALKRFNNSAVDTKLPHGTLQALSGSMLYGPVDWKANNTRRRNDADLGTLRTSLGRCKVGTLGSGLL